MPRAKFARMSVEELKRELLRRQRTLPQLIAQRDALDRQIAELYALGDVQTALRPAGREPAKKRARKIQGRMKAARIADKLAEVLQRKKRSSLAEAILLGDKNRFRAALGGFSDAPEPKLSDEIGTERPAPSTDAGGSALHLADERGKDRAVLRVVEDGSKLHLADENGKIVWSQS